MHLPNFGFRKVYRVYVLFQAYAKRIGRTMAQWLPRK